MKKNSVYKTASGIIGENPGVSIDVKNVVDEVMKLVNGYEFDFEELLTFYVKSMVVIAANQRGYYSPIRGTGIMVNIERCAGENGLRDLRLVEQNEKKDRDAKQQVLRKVFELVKVVEGQLAILPNGEIVGVEETFGAEEAFGT